MSIVDDYAETNGISIDDASKLLGRTTINVKVTHKGRMQAPKMDDVFESERKSMKPVEPLHVVVRFGADIPGEVQARALMEFERTLRRESGGLWIEVFKEIMGDDSKLRALMTPEQRGKL